MLPATAKGVAAMDRNQAQSRRTFAVERKFVMSRLAQQYLALAYERLVPTRRQPLSGERCDRNSTTRCVARRAVVGA